MRVSRRREKQKSAYEKTICNGQEFSEAPVKEDIESPRNDIL